MAPLEVGALSLCRSAVDVVGGGRRMRLRMLVVSCVAAALLGACGGAGEPGPADAPTGAATEAPSPTPDGVAAGQVAQGHSLTSSDGRLEITGTGSAALEVTVHELRSGAPEPPRG